jgi:DNA (cytosine-5)-methyltransferase 1
MVRAAEILEPRVVLIENVPAIERDHFDVCSRAQEALERLGYATATKIVSLADIGVPQRRQRHVLLAVAGGGIPDLAAAIDTARVEKQRDVRWAIADLRGQWSSPLDDAGALSPENQDRARYLLQSGEYDLPNALRPPCQRGVHKYKSMYGRLRWDEPAQTITSGFGSPGQGRYLHPDEPRTLSPHEAARLQFLPDWFDFSGLASRRSVARTIGNAVPPKLSFVIAHHVLARRSKTGSRSAPRAVTAGRTMLGC